MTAVQSPAEAGDVTNALERPLTPDETRVLPNWLEQAWIILRREVPGIAGRMVEDPDADGVPPAAVSTAEVRQVLVAMVERKLRNPDGVRSYTVDDGTTTLDQAISSGQIYATPDEVSRLSAPVAGGGLYSIPLRRA